MVFHLFSLYKGKLVSTSSGNYSDSKFSSTHSLSYKTVQINQDDKGSDWSMSVPKREIPVLPRRATPSNIRSKSGDVRNILFTNQVQTEANNPPVSAIARYESTRVRSRQATENKDNSRNSAKSVDHIKDYMLKKKEKEVLFGFIKDHANIVEFEKYVKTSNSDMNCRDENWLTPLHIATKQDMSTAWINILIRHGADINRLTPSNRTALHYA